MKKFKLKKIFLIISISVLSCGKENDELELNDFKGFYKIKSISSSYQIDLSNDGLKSNDYLQEIKSNYTSYNGDIINFLYDNESRANFAQARPTKYQSNNAQFLDIRFPIQDIDSIYQGNDNYVINNMGYEKMGTSLTYKLTNNNIEIESDSFNQYEFYGMNNFEINRINKNEFEIEFEFKVYDFSENAWIETNLKANYIKVEE